MARRTWFVWHSWIGLTAGLLMFVICWSGTVAVFSRDIDGLLDPRLSASSSVTVAWQLVHDKAQARYPAWRINQINAPLAPGHAVETLAEDEHGVLRRIYSDPANGNVLAATSYFNVQRFFRSLHMSLFIGELPVFGIPLGYLLVGLLSFVLFASAVTSLIFYRRFWRGLFRLSTAKGAKVFWSDLHKLSGLWSLWFLLVIAVTGIWYLVEWKAPDGPPGPEPPQAVAGASPLPIDRLVDHAQRSYPELRIRVVALYDLRNGLFEVQGQDGSWLLRDRGAKSWVNAFTGAALGVHRPAEVSAHARWIDTADPLHFGDFGGLFVKTIWFLFGLALSGLCLTGAYLQAKRQRRHQDIQYRKVVLGAYGTTLAVLTLSAVYAHRELLTYGTNGALPEVPAPQLMFIGLWLVSTFIALTLWMRAVR